MNEATAKELVEAYRVKSFIEAKIKELETEKIKIDIKVHVSTRNVYDYRNQTVLELCKKAILEQYKLRLAEIKRKIAQLGGVI